MLYFSRYARLYLAIQFFDPDSLLPPPFTFLTLIMYLVRGLATSDCCHGGVTKSNSKGYSNCSSIDIEYRSLLFAFIDSAKPVPEKQDKSDKSDSKL